MPRTSNHDYRIPPARDERWATKMTQNLERFEGDIPLLDAAGTLDASIVDDPHTPHDGAWLVARDTGAVFIGDGESWTHRGAIPRTATASTTGDGTTTQFTFAHGLGTTPAWVGVTPTSSAAAPPHHVVSRTSSEVTIEYADAPADGASLSWELAVIADDQPTDMNGGTS